VQSFGKNCKNKLLEAVLIISLELLILIGLPTLTYFYAQQLGTSPWTWFFIGCLIPGLVTIILSLLPDRAEKLYKSEKTE
jgi:hypothetical protein